MHPKTSLEFAESPIAIGTPVASARRDLCRTSFEFMTSLEKGTSVPAGVIL